MWIPSNTQTHEYTHTHMHTNNKVRHRAKHCVNENQRQALTIYLEEGSGFDVVKNRIMPGMGISVTWLWKQKFYSRTSFVIIRHTNQANLPIAEYSAFSYVISVLHWPCFEHVHPKVPEHLYCPYYKNAYKGCKYFSLAVSFKHLLQSIFLLPSKLRMVLK